jgi:hypothetical protein
MGIKQRHGRMTIKCDVQGCGNQHVEQAGDLEQWRAGLAEATAMGWRMTKDRGLWIAECPVCTGSVSRPS